MSEKLASEIEDCSDCPLSGECNGYTQFGEPYCASWDPDDIIYTGMLNTKRYAAMQAHENQRKRERSLQAKRAWETRKKYAYLDEKYAKFKDWLKASEWSRFFTISARRRDKVYLCVSENIRASFIFNLESERLSAIRAKVTLADRNVFERFNNDFKGYYYGVRPKDRDFIAEISELVAERMKNYNL